MTVNRHRHRFTSWLHWRTTYIAGDYVVSQRRLWSKVYYRLTDRFYR